MPTGDQTHEADRIIVLERRLHTSIERFDRKLDDIHSALQSLVRIEERQVLLTQRLSEFNSDVGELKTRLRLIELAVPENLDKRLASIEAAMPGLKETRKWVVTGVVAGVGMMGVALVNLVLKT